MDYHQQAALDFVNTVRARQGRPSLSALPKGWRRVANQCPVARAAGGTVTYDALVEGVGRTPLPDAVANFVMGFDQGCYPELVAPGGVITSAPFTTASEPDESKRITVNPPVTIPEPVTVPEKEPVREAPVPVEPEKVPA